MDVQASALPVVDIDELERNPPMALGPRRAPAFVEAAGLCLSEAGHASTVKLVVLTTDEQNAVNLRWSLRQDAARSWDERESTEHAAVAVGLSLLRQTMQLEALERGRIGGGFDYWLGDISWSYQAVVEISGIRRGTESQVAGRLRAKKAQIQNTHGQLAAYALVVEFSMPLATWGAR